MINALWVEQIFCADVFAVGVLLQLGFSGYSIFPAERDPEDVVTVRHMDVQCRRFSEFWVKSLQSHSRKRSIRVCLWEITCGPKLLKNAMWLSPQEMPGCNRRFNPVNLKADFSDSAINAAEASQGHVLFFGSSHVEFMPMILTLMWLGVFPKILAFRIVHMRPGACSISTTGDTFRCRSVVERSDRILS